MRTRRNPTIWLAALLALSVACGDDDDNGGEGNNTGGNNTGNSNGGSTGDADGGGNGEVDLAVSCKAAGLYDGFQGTDLKANIASTGACITDKQILEVCELNPSTAAAAEGAKCFGGGKSGDALRTCTIEGDSTLGAGGLRKATPNLSDGCLDCYAESVACSAENNCGVPCVTDPTGDECVNCREEAGCTPGFYACSGLPRAEDIEK